MSLQTGFTDLGVGTRHSCAVTSGGEVVCWGFNFYGQLGDGTKIDRTAPVTVTGLANMSAVVAGADHSCALHNDGQVSCWGDDSVGQLGNSTVTDGSLSPVEVEGLTGVTQLFGGYSTNCALNAANDLYCWGGGDGVPVLVEDLAGVTVTAVALGEFHSCVLTDSGAVYCEGSNSSGQLGDGSEEGALGDYLLVGGIGGPATGVAAGADHSCAATATGVRCWGDNRVGQLGDNTSTDRDTPDDVVNAEPATAVDAAELFSCAVTTAGGVQCWGNNEFGQLGNASTSSRRNAVAAIGVDDVAQLGVGEHHTCVLTNAGAVECWGSNTSGQLGIGVNARPAVPVDVLSLDEPVVAVGLGENHSCAVLATGALECWGSNSRGQLGNGSIGSADVPVAVARLEEGVAGVAPGGEHTCAYLTDGAAKCWGSNDNGQVGDGSDAFLQLRPEDVSGLDSGVNAMRAGSSHTCAIVDSDLMCWGRNTSGMLGDGTFSESNVPVMVNGLGEVVDVAAGSYTSCALNAAGEVYCWGENVFGELGNGSTGARGTPDRIEGLSGTPQQIEGGSKFICALLESGNVDCWGVNNFGQLGSGSFANRYEPGLVVGLEGGATALAVGNSHACALMDDGTVRCWGYNTSSQLGNPDETDNAHTPVTVANLTDATAIAAGANHACALVAGGGLKCWGANFNGQLGDGTAWSTVAMAVNETGADPDPDPDPEPGDDSAIFLPVLAR